METKKEKKKKLTLSGKSTMLSDMRTLLSYIRTSVVLVSLAFAFMKLDKENPLDAFTIVLFVLSGVVLVIGFIDYFITKHFVDDITNEDLGNF